MKKKSKDKGINIELEMNYDSNRDYFLSSNENKSSSESNKKKCKCIVFILIGIIIVLCAAAAAVYFFVFKKPPESPPSEQPDPSTPSSPPIQEWPEDVNITKAEEIFSPLFKISTKEKTLTQLSQKSFQNYESVTNGQNTSYTILTKALYDIFTINSTSPEENYKILFTSMYTTVITVKSHCSKISVNPENDDCQLEMKLDLNHKDENNLEINKEVSEDLIRKAILPICIVQHSDTNLIFSITCPETLSENFKQDILRAFSNIKPGSIKGFELDKEYADTQQREKDDNIYIDSFDNVCSNPNIDPLKISICNLTKNIITDKDGNLISNKISNTTKTITDENNYFSENYTYEYKNIPKDNSSNFNEEIYKNNLNSLIDLISPLMKKEIKIENLTDIVIDLMTEDKEELNNNTNLRCLYEIESSIPGVHEENIFNKTILDISIELGLKSDIGLSEGQSTKAVSTHNINKENYTDLSNYRIQTKLYDTLNKFISLSNGANQIANKLYEDLNEPILKMGDIINENIGKINVLLANKDLSEIFDSTLAIKELDTLPFSFIAATENLYNSFNDLEINILYTIDSAKKKLKDDVTNFLSDSHNLIFKLFNNLTEIADALSSDKNKIVEIASYYLNDTDTSYYEILNQAKYILDNYYKNEKNLILPLVNNIIEKFSKNSINSIEKYLTMLDHISDRLDNGDLTISLANTEDYQKSINNIFNSKSKANKIIEIVEEKFSECINLQPNGYFETANELEENEKSYGIISNKATTIAYALDKNELIDKTFDNIMTSFRDKFLTILNYMDDSVYQKFSLEDNVLGTSLFNATYLNELDEDLKIETINILNYIKNENDNYLKSVNQIFNDFTDEKGNNLDQIISELIDMMTDIYFDNLNKAFNESLYFTFQNISYIIERNTKLANEYFEEVISKNSFHITDGFKNKYNEFYNSIQEILMFVNKNLKNNLAFVYKNVINQIRALLQSIKSNSILEKYNKQLPLTVKHLNSIKELFSIFNRHISDTSYNDQFLSPIINFIESKASYLNNILNNFQNIYDDMTKKESSNILNDYDLKRVVKGSRYCCKRILGICVRHCYHPDTIYYDGYNVGTTNNHLQLEIINFDIYMKPFHDKYNELYPKLSEDISSYNFLLKNLDNEIDLKKNESIKSENGYLDNIYQKTNYIIEEKLDYNLLIAAYNYFKNKIENTLPNELNDILIQWKNFYDEIQKDLNSNKENFKSSVFEFFYLSNFYLQTYVQNISYGYGESIVEKMKNDFIYTIKYYYDLILSKINQTYSYILSNIPINEKPFEDILNKRIEEIKQSHAEILNEFEISRTDTLNKTKQEMILQVNPKNFFYSNDIIKNHIKTFNTTINEKIINIALVAYQIQKDNPEELIIAKFYLENSINGKQIKEIYEMINKVNFVDLQKDVYQNLIDDTWKIERDEFIKNILNTLNQLNENNMNNFDYEFDKYLEILLNKLYDEFYTKDKLIYKINSLFEKGINNANESSEELIDELLNVVLNNITSHIENEATRLSNELTSYSRDFTDIENRLNNYKTTIYERFYSTITYVINDFHEHILEKFYRNYIEKGLSDYEKNLDDKDFGTKTIILQNKKLWNFILPNIEILH